MKKLKQYKCLESVNSLYVELTDQGYNAQPCCLYKNDKITGVKNIEDLLSNPYINAIRQKFAKNWKRPECIDCIRNEELGKESKRKRSLQKGFDKGIIRWDLRPSNTCNLKCAMCNPSNSSKWMEDAEIWQKYNYKIADIGRVREDIDWDWIYTKVVDKAEYIYIAGGEPFYMKNVHKFLGDLSKHKWNCENTRIQIQTNGISNTPKFLNILSKFKRLEFSMSIDGWGDVNELIRFPTNHNTFVEQTDELMQLDTEDIYFNITVQAMNLPNIDTLVSNIKDRWNGRYDIHKLHAPRHLRINSLKPSVVEKVLETTIVPELKHFCSDYAYDDEYNKKMQQFLLDLDAKRKTDSKKIIEWCFE